MNHLKLIRSNALYGLVLGCSFAIIYTPTQCITAYWYDVETQINTSSANLQALEFLDFVKSVANSVLGALGTHSRRFKY